ncbi:MULTISPECIES: ethanolamine utilization microcompartment protein EutN [Pseudomonas]|jgi:ethanolamine utilization protein EutN|uniref:Ethanolamine utilization microcompartment protein EutN n=1 Tax=Pseudomonas citronellolis TaxID=53408 RepID=A0A127N076_9PSED|nr:MULTISPECIES: ethanolamine utilization microcompartment protein EutN [Pseudomonas]KSW24385.1 ethanolamine utilization protein EutN [Pseudomonas sp. ADP]AMO78721.1 Ethanolamine utilization protein EutN [Pseudomonas citronellolis]ANI17368.1 ethanolamine utilization protein EutN [Pseudomonas citronellolis]KES20727.1 ethanolamine utilization protein EutN [Pseudomonas sp. AAC]KRV68529.1 ethanolamine utilization protein EutN [Pseudomonas citronellolis]
MKLAIVVGQVVCTVKHPGVGLDRLLLVEMLDRAGRPDGERHVASDSLGAGNGEWVMLAGGSAARQALAEVRAPIDLCVVGIVDEAVLDGSLLYRK